MTPLANASFTVLVVDDDASVRSCYQRLLGRSGYRALTEGDPSRLLNGRDLSEVDMILLDYKMPKMDGLTLLAELRRRECRARCILLSAFVNDDVRHQAQQLGVDRVFEKPVDITQLRGALTELLADRRPAVDRPN